MSSQDVVDNTLSQRQVSLELNEGHRSSVHTNYTQHYSKVGWWRTLYSTGDFRIARRMSPNDVIEDVTEGKTPRSKSGREFQSIAPKATPRLLALETFGWRPVSHGMHAAATGKEETQIPSASMCGMKTKSKFMLYRFSLQFFWYFILFLIHSKRL